METKNNNNPKKYISGAFNHKFSFKFFHYPEVISVDVENLEINASLRQGKIIVLGNYDVVICYHKEGEKEGKHYHKRASKEFGFVLSPPDNLTENQVQQLMGNLKLETSLSISFSNTTSCIKSTLEKMKLLPYTMQVVVSGNVKEEQPIIDEPVFINDPDNLFKENTWQEQNDYNETTTKIPPTVARTKYTNYQLYCHMLMKHAQNEYSRRKRFK